MRAEDHFGAIADGLAGPGYAVADDFLDKDEVRAILSSPYFSESVARMKAAGMGKYAKAEASIRGDHIFWIDREAAPDCIRTYFQRIFLLIAFLNRELFLSLKDIEAHLTRYAPGTFYKRHLDQFRHDDHRRLSVLLYLNPAWKSQDGGELRIHTKEGRVDVLPEAGRLAIFRSDLLEHEVLPATRERLSITGWILDRLVP
jgi:SM-20-related protein